MLNLTEGQLKSAVSDYLEIGQNQGKWVYLRLNAGDFIEVRGNTRRRIKGCPKGTADFVVIRAQRGTFRVYPKVIFIELKSEKGRWPAEQRAFKKMVEMQGCEYHLIRSFEGLEETLK